MKEEKEKPVVKSDHAHFLKGHASWLYCDNCNKTVAYLCYVTYTYFKFSFQCRCGNHGMIENKFLSADVNNVSVSDSLEMGSANKRYCCSNDHSPLFSVVSKNIESYEAEIICKECNTKYMKSESFE